MRKGSKQDRIAWLEQFIRQHPAMGRRTIAKAMREEFGQAIRTIELQKVHDRVTFMESLTYKKPLGVKPLQRLVAEGYLEKVPKEAHIRYGFDRAYHMLVTNGFSRDEIRSIFGAQGTIGLINSKPFLDMMKERRQWARGLRQRGWDPERIALEVDRYYTRYADKPNKYDRVMDFLRKHYKPRVKVDYLVVSKSLAARRAKRRAALAREETDWEKRKRERATRATQGLYRR